jgi:hypothetical protein
MFPPYEPRFPWPVIVTSKDNRKATARLVMDVSADEHLLFMCVMDDTLEVWLVPSPEIRFQPNWTYGWGKRETH